MNIKPIKTRSDYKAALKIIEGLMDATAGTPDGDRLDVLSVLVEAYETKNFPIDAPDPVEAIKFRMEQQGLERRDLEPMIGTRARVSEVLSGKRGLSLNMIRRLNTGLNIPAGVLIQESQGKKGTSR